MNILNYSLTALISYIGLFVGFILALIAKEELKAGKKYFVTLQKIILLLIFIFLLIFELSYIPLLLISIFIIIYLFKTKKSFNESLYIYILLGIIFYLSSKTLNLFIIESSLIFLYGIPTGTLLTKKNETIINILKNISFIVVVIILFLIL